MRKIPQVLRSQAEKCNGTADGWEKSNRCRCWETLRAGFGKKEQSVNAVFAVAIFRSADAQECLVFTSGWVLMSASFATIANFLSSTLRRVGEVETKPISTNAPGTTL